jgi:hypothetical protein
MEPREPAGISTKRLVMIHRAQEPRDASQAVVYQFIRLIGRPPTPKELIRYQAVRSRAVLRHPGRVRRTAARIITRL